LGSGYWKYVGIDVTAMDDRESSFWGETAAPTHAQKRSRTAFATPSKPASVPASASPSPPRADVTEFVHLDGTKDYVDAVALEYYLAVNNNDTNAASNSIKSRGAKKFGDAYRRAAELDPDRRGTGGGSVVG